MTHMKSKKISRWQKPRLPNGLVAALIGGLSLAALVIYSVWSAMVPTNGTTVPVEVKGLPSIKLDRDKFDLGDVPLGQTVQVSFQVANVGDQQLRFSELPYVEVVEGCCPPRASIGSMVLNPGETTIVSMEFMMHEGMGGFHNFSVHMPTNDPNQPDRTVTVLSNWVN
jgi:hypothetical protein